jgi:hydroxyethylthiazole kinase-like uncharacterized protein yjeF
MQAADAHAMKREGEVALMRRAGLGIADAIRGRARGGRIVAFAGPGNNGGDAFAACAELADEIDCIVYAHAASRPSAARDDAERRARAAGVRIAAFPSDAAAAKAALADATFIIDGVLGVGARNETTLFAHVIEACNAADKPVCALDLPTGIDATTGACAHPAVIRATLTVTLGAPKLGLLLEPARPFVGELFLADIGIREEDILAALAAADGPAYHVLVRTEFMAALPRRGELVEKRGAGAPLLIVGSSQFPGAAVLSARGAARAGAGYVTVATPSEAAPILRTHLIEQVVVEFDEREVDRSIDGLAELARRAQGVGIGPGLGLTPSCAAVTRGFVTRTELPLVIDASALAHLNEHLDLLRNRECICTPHENEFARLSGKGEVAQGTRITRLREFVDRTGVATLLKGSVTLIYDGSDMHLNPSGTNALATAGTGDVLTGMIATFLAQGLKPVDAARMAAFWHGDAGRLAASRRGVGVVAGDLPELLAEAALLEEPLTHSRLTKIF